MSHRIQRGQLLAQVVRFFSCWYCEKCKLEKHRTGGQPRYGPWVGGSGSQKESLTFQNGLDILLEMMLSRVAVQASVGNLR